MTRFARTRLVAPSLLLIAAGLASSPARAEGTFVFAESPDRLSRGDAKGVAVTERGRMFLAPRLSRLNSESSSQVPTHVWSMVHDRAGNLYLGTGPEGRIFRVSPSGAETLLFTVEEPMVTALLLLPSGELLAGTAPEGKVYRIGGDGEGSVYAETGARYVWSLATGAGGEVYAATGEEGVIYEIRRSGAVSTFFDADEAHIVTLVARPGGGLLAGGAGRGLVYQIDRDGNGHVLHDDELPEVTGILPERDGGVVVALLAAPEADPRRPFVRIQLPETRAVGADSVQDLDEQDGRTLEGSIEGLPLPRDRRADTPRGRVLRISPDGVATELWRSASEAPFSLAREGEGRVLFGTGEPARVYRAEPDGDVALLATLREAQTTGLVDLGGWTALATSNPVATYRLDRGNPDSGLLLSRPIDAGGVARWGSIRWREEGDPGRVEFYTRTGNSAVPDATWSAWSPALTIPGGSPVANPDGRFLQWRARLSGRESNGARTSGIEVSYAPYNRAPEIQELRLEGGAAAVSGRAVFRFNCKDPDGDPVEVELQYRRLGTASWLTASRSEPVEPYEPGSRAWNEGQVSWDTASVEEGRYETRVLATDQAANHPGEGMETPARDRPVVAVDRTAPTVRIERAADGGVEVTVIDGESTVRRIELVREGRARFAPRPVDGVCDGPEERFVLSPGQVGGEGWLVRALDAAENAAEQPLPARNRLD